jgi:prolyl-tRNA editing enzyme YbaK/EbsC (Cys-tRNA(Pro) deacylase)
MSEVRFDHIAIAARRMTDGPAVLVGALGGRPTGDGGPSGAYTWGHWGFTGGGRLEILEPLGDDGFLHRFLAARGPGVHHVTFVVPVLQQACDRAVALGYRIVGFDDSDPGWAEAFLHPKEALGIVVQIVESRAPGGDRRVWPAPAGPPAPPPPVTMVGLRRHAVESDPPGIATGGRCRARLSLAGLAAAHRGRRRSGGRGGTGGDRVRERPARGPGRDAASGAGRHVPTGDVVTDEGREVEQRVVSVLDRLGVPYELQPIDPAFADTTAYCEKYGVPLDRAANTLVVVAKKEPRRYAACVVKATTRLDVNHAVRRLLDASRISFASADETRTLTGMLLGGVTVFALPDDLPVYVDDKVMAHDWVILGSGSRSSKVKVSPEVLRRLPGAQVVAGLSVGA